MKEQRKEKEKTDKGTASHVVTGHEHDAQQHSERYNATRTETQG